MNRHESPASEAEPTGGLQVARSWFFAKLLAVVGFFAGGCVALGIGFFASHPPPPPPGQGICGMGIIAGFIIMLLSPAAALLCSLVVAPVGAILDLVFPRVSPRVWHVGIALANGIFTVATVLFALLCVPFPADDTAGIGIAA